MLLVGGKGHQRVSKHRHGCFPAVSKLVGELEDPPRPCLSWVKFGTLTHKVSPTKLGCRKKTPCPSSLRAHSRMGDGEVNNQNRVGKSSGRGPSREGHPEEVTWQRQGRGRAGWSQEAADPRGPTDPGSTKARDAIKVKVTVPQRLGLPFLLKMEKLRI